MTNDFLDENNSVPRKDEPRGGRPSGLSGYLRQPKVLEKVPFSAATLWRKVKAGTFPAPVRLSDRIVAWRIDDVVEWMRGPPITVHRPEGEAPGSAAPARPVQHQRPLKEAKAETDREDHPDGR